MVFMFQFGVNINIILPDTACHTYCLLVMPRLLCNKGCHCSCLTNQFTLDLAQKRNNNILGAFINYVERKMKRLQEDRFNLGDPVVYTEFMIPYRNLFDRTNLWNNPSVYVFVLSTR